MSAESDHVPVVVSEPLKGLPPVTPPSGRHIVQLFLIPGLIVAGAVTILLGFSWLAGGSRSPEQILKNIDNANPEIRWRAASDLAQVLKRDDKLAADAAFGLRLVERMVKALEELDRAEKSVLEIPNDIAHKRERVQGQESLVTQRNYVVYLAASLGNFSVPVGAPILCDVAKNGRGGDQKLRAHVRRQAVWALANMGESRKRFEGLSPEKKAEVRGQMESEATNGADAAKKGAEAGLAALDGKSVGVIDVLADCANEPFDIFLREQVGHALGFWEGDAREKKVAETTLLMLSQDSGRGERIEVDDGAPAQPPRASVPKSPPGWEVRYNATIALARRGSDKVKDGFPWEMLLEMLDEEHQFWNFKHALPNGREVSDSGAAQLTIITALQAVAELHRRQPGLDLAGLFPAIDKLAQSRSAAVSSWAKRTRQSLN
jgi:hypothetical protein